MLHLPQNLKLIRLLSGKTQTEFGEKLNASKAMVVSYESGKANPDELFLSRVSKLAGVTENDLLKKKLTEADIKGGNVEKLEKLAVDMPETTKEPLERAIENLTEADLINARNIERLLNLLEHKLGFVPEQLRSVAREGKENLKKRTGTKAG